MDDPAHPAPHPEVRIGRLWIVAGAIALVYLSLLCHDIGRPWLDDHDGFSGALYSLAGRNIARHGFIASRFGCPLDAGQSGEPPHMFYVTHPPLLALMVGASHSLFGPREWATRIIPIAFSLLSIIVLFLYVSRLANAGVGLVAMGVYAALPMAAHYGSMPCHEAPTMGLILLAAFAAHEYRERSGRKWLIAFVVSLLCSQLMGWPGFFAGAGFVVAGLLMRRVPSLLRMGIAALVTSTVAAVAVVTHLALISGSLSELVARFQDRAGVGEGSQFTLWEFAHRMAWRSAMMFTPTLCILAAAGLVALIFAPRLRHIRLDASLLLAPALLHVLVFRQGAMIHDYWLYYFSPVVALLAGTVLFWVSGLARGTRKHILAGAVIALLAVSVGMSARTIGSLRGLTHPEHYSGIMAVKAALPPGRPYVMIGNSPAIAFYLDAPYEAPYPYTEQPGGSRRLPDVTALPPGTVIAGDYKLLENLSEELHSSGFEELIPERPYGFRFLVRGR